jgi:hypothetical protein
MNVILKGVYGIAFIPVPEVYVAVAGGEETQPLRRAANQDISAIQVYAGMAWAYRYKGRYTVANYGEYDQGEKAKKEGCGRSLMQSIRQNGESVM